MVRCTSEVEADARINSCHPAGRDGRYHPCASRRRESEGKLPPRENLLAGFSEMVVAARGQPRSRAISFLSNAAGCLRSERRGGACAGARSHVAFDFQGLLQSALAGRAAHAKTLYGFSSAVARESHAAWFYHRAINVTGPHRVERNLQLIAAAGAVHLGERAWIPPGREEGRLPRGPFVLASPFAGWAGKEWPLEIVPTTGAIAETAKDWNSSSMFRKPEVDETSRLAERHCAFEFHPGSDRRDTPRNRHSRR